MCTKFLEKILFYGLFLFFEEVVNLKEMEFLGILKIKKILLNKINHKFLVNHKDNLKENQKILQKNREVMLSKDNQFN